MHPTRREILLHLKRMTALGVRELSEALNLTPMAVRQHLAALERQNRVESDDVKGARGRPRRMYRLTDRGHDLFPSSYHDLALSLLEEVELSAGEQKLDQIFDLRTQRLVEDYRQRLAGK